MCFSVLKKMLSRDSSLESSPVDVISNHPEEEVVQTPEWAYIKPPLPIEDQAEKDALKMPISIEQKRVAKSLLSVFETGKPTGDYSAAVVLPDGAGISYGKHQATDKGGNLDGIVMRYIDLKGKYSGEFEKYFPALEANDSASVDPNSLPEWTVSLLDLLKKAGTDPVMHRAQDQIFDEEYWQPCVAQCTQMWLKEALSWAIVYDTCIHSGPGGVARIRRRFSEMPPSRGGDEKKWAKAYVNARRDWLANYKDEGHIVRRTVVRMDVFLDLIAKKNWSLNTPIQIGHPYRVVVN